MKNNGWTLKGSFKDKEGGSANFTGKKYAGIDVDNLVLYFDYDSFWCVDIYCSQVSDASDLASAFSQKYKLSLSQVDPYLEYRSKKGTYVLKIKKMVKISNMNFTKPYADKINKDEL